jgi:hypothetical protein
MKKAAELTRPASSFRNAGFLVDLIDQADRYRRPVDAIASRSIDRLSERRGGSF